MRGREARIALGQEAPPVFGSTPTPSDACPCTSGSEGADNRPCPPPRFHHVSLRAGHPFPGREARNAPPKGGCFSHLSLM